MRHFSVVSNRNAKVEMEVVTTDMAVVTGDAGGLITVGLETLDAHMGRWVVVGGGLGQGVSRGTAVTGTSRDTSSVIAF